MPLSERAEFHNLAGIARPHRFEIAAFVFVALAAQEFGLGVYRVGPHEFAARDERVELGKTRTLEVGG